MVLHVSYDSVQPLYTNNVKHRLRPGCCLQEAFLEVVMKALTDTCKTRGRSPIFFGISWKQTKKESHQPSFIPSPTGGARPWWSFPYESFRAGVAKRERKAPLLLSWVAGIPPRDITIEFVRFPFFPFVAWYKPPENPQLSHKLVSGRMRHKKQSSFMLQDVGKMVQSSARSTSSSSTSTHILNTQKPSTDAFMPPAVYRDVSLSVACAVRSVPGFWYSFP